MCPFGALLLLGDCYAAFRTTLHRWMKTVWRIAIDNIGRLNCREALYFLVLALSDMRSFLFFAFLGVIQGCPLVSTSFIIAFSPFLIYPKFGIITTEDGIVIACAGDLGRAFRAVPVLHKLYTFYRLADIVAGLAFEISEDPHSSACSKPFQRDHGY